MAFSGTSTPKFDANYDPTFGTPLFMDSHDKQDYFSMPNKLHTNFEFQNMFDSPYPQHTDITPPHTATDPPPGWSCDAFGGPEPSIEDHFEQNMPDMVTSTVKIQYGQTTPPDEAMRAPSMEDLKDGFPTEPKTLIKRESTTIIKPAKSSKRSKKNSSKLEQVDEENDKRSKFLERNRVAASKCRQKKKEYNNNLESRAKEYERQNAMLKLDLDRLQMEKIELMTQMALHNPHECGCHKIHQHVANFKAQYAEPLTQSHSHSSNSYSNSNSNSSCSHSSSHSRNGSIVSSGGGGGGSPVSSNQP